MRHNVSGKKLGRDAAHRKSLLRNLSSSLILHGKVDTTLVKAKYVRPFVEKLVTSAKKGDYSALRKISPSVTTDAARRKLLLEIAPGYASRNGGYTRIRKIGRRSGDNAEMARIEWVVKEPDPSAKPKSAAKSVKSKDKKEKK